MVRDCLIKNKESVAWTGHKPAGKQHVPETLELIQNLPKCTSTTCFATVLAPSVTVASLSIVFSHWLGVCPFLLCTKSAFYAMLHVSCLGMFDRNHKRWVTKSSTEQDTDDMEVFLS